jgi:AcrR family transcriptional regulator
MQLTRRRIISVAMTLIEQDGAEAFSMARLATELGCGIMILYGFVPSRSELLDGVTDQVLTSMTAAQLPACGWEGQLRALATASRQVARTFPQCATLAFSRRPLVSGKAAPGKEGPGKAAPGKEGPGKAAPGKEGPGKMGPAALALTSLCEAGLTRADAARTVRALTAYVIGSARCEPSSDDADADFEFGLSMLISAVTALCPAAAGT